MPHRSLAKPRARLKPLCRLLQAAALSTGTLALAPPAHADDINWTYANTLWSVPASWGTGVRPGVGDWAVFGASAPAISVVDDYSQLSGVRFLAGANVLLGVDDRLIVENGFVNEDGVLRSVDVAASGEIHIVTGTVSGPFGFQNNGRIWFANTSNAGTGSSFTNIAGGFLDFEMFSSASGATIFNQAGGTTRFNTGSTAASASIRNFADGSLEFNHEATAGSANITNDNGATTTFSGTATAGDATIQNHGDLTFRDSSTAGAATITTTATGLTVFEGNSSGGTANLVVDAAGRLGFAGQSTAGNATITHHGNSAFVQQSNAGQANILNAAGTLQFLNEASAADATITNESALAFRNNASAGAATIITRAGATTSFHDSATGGTARIVMEGGTLDLTARAGLMDVGSIEGTGLVSMGGGTALAAGSLNTDTTFAGVLTGGGAAFAKRGTGTLTLTGASNYTAGTLIEDGTLQLGDGGTTGSITGMVINDGTLAFNRSNFLLFDGEISGSGVVDVRDGAVALVADNTYTGGTVIRAGAALQVGDGGATGSITGDVANAGELYFVRTGTTTFTGSISGSGNLTNQLGQLVLTGNNSYTGTTTILAPVVVGDGGTTGSPGTGAIVNDASLTIDRAGTLSLPGDISGSGSLRIIGPGQVVLAGTSTYTGATDVERGTLLVNGSITSATRVASGATLGGTGRTGNVDVESGGALAPGQSIGTLRVGGDLRLRAGSIFRVEVDPAGAADRVEVDGAATIDGGTVDVRAGSGTYARNTRYTLLTAAGGRTGEFDTVTTDLAFLTPTLRYEGSSVLLDLESNRVAYADVALTPNQRAVGNYLQEFADAPGNADAATLVSRIDSLDAEGARRAFDNLSGSAHAVASQVATAVGRNLSATMAARTGFSAAAAGGVAATLLPTQFASVDARSWQPAPVVASDAAPSPANFSTAVAGAAAAPATGFWVQAVGGGGSSDSDGNGPSSDYRNGGLLLGYDLPVAPGWVAGASLGYVRSSWDADTGGTAEADGDLESPQFGLYARYAQPTWRLHLDATYVRHDFDAQRRVAIGADTQTARSSHDGHEWGLAAQVEFPRAWGDWEVAPLAGLRLARLSEDGFTETGAGASNLTVSGRDTEQAVLSGGVQFAKRFASGRGGMELRAVASHLFGDADSAVTSQLAGQPTRFTARGTPLKRNALTLGATVAGAFSRQVSGYLDAAYELRGSGQNAFGVTAGVRVAW